jgi:excisionase family DNA binding protein
VRCRRPSIRSNCAVYKQLSRWRFRHSLRASPWVRAMGDRKGRDMTDHYISLADGSDYVGCSVRHLRRLISDGQLPAYRVGTGTSRIIRIKRTDLDALLRPVVPGKP